MDLLEIQNEIENNYLSSPDAAERLGVTITRVQELCKQGRLQGAIKVGRTWLIPCVAVEHFTRQKGGRPKKKTEREMLNEILSGKNTPHA